MDIETEKQQRKGDDGWVGNVKVDMLFFNITRTHYNAVEIMGCRLDYSHSRLITTRHRQGPWRSSPWIHITRYIFCKIYLTKHWHTNMGPFLLFFFFIHIIMLSFFFQFHKTFWGYYNQNIIIRFITILPLHLGPIGARPSFVSQFYKES